MAVSVWNQPNEPGRDLRRYGGIHFKTADLVGRDTGDMVAANAWAKALELFGDKAEREH